MYRSYYTHRLRYSMSPVCVTFHNIVTHQIYWDLIDRVIHLSLRWLVLFYIEWFSFEILSEATVHWCWRVLLKANIILTRDSWSSFVWMGNLMKLYFSWLPFYWIQFLPQNNNLRSLTQWLTFEEGWHLVPKHVFSVHVYALFYLTGCFGNSWLNLSGPIYLGPE